MRALYTPTERAERLIAAGRLVLAIFSLIAIWSDPTTPSRWESATYSLLGAYTIYAFIAAVISLRRPLLTFRGRIASHLFDLAIFSAFIFLTEGPISPFFLYFVFSVFCATLRFDSRGLLATAGAALLIYIAIGLGGSLVVNAPGFEPDRFLIRCVYLVVLAALLYYLQTYQRTLQGELTSLAEWPRELPATFDDVIFEGVYRTGSLLRSRHVALIWEDEDEPWMQLGELRDGEFRTERLQPTSCTPVVASPLENAAFIAAGDAVSVAGSEARTIISQPLHRFWAERWHPSSIVSAPFRGESATGRLISLNGRDATVDDVVLVELASRLIASRIDQYRLLERSGEAASTAERLRISRDLHDGVLQSLSGVALRVRALQREITNDPDSAGAAAADILRLLEDDQREIRAMVRGLRLTDNSSGSDTELSARLEVLRERLLAEWQVQLDLQGVPANDAVGPVRADIVHIVSEAAANASRHGRASRVHVRFGGGEGRLYLQIRDNGNGFPFEGRLDAESLRARGLGPRSLLERIESLGGSMNIESGRGGALLDITLDTRRSAS